MSIVAPAARNSPYAVISECGDYRYALWRELKGSESPVLFIMLNPSTADAAENDPTIKRCIDFSDRWNACALHVVNLFAFRSTEPQAMKALPLADAIGAGNDDYITNRVKRCTRIVAAWGNHGQHGERYIWALRNIPNMLCLGLTKQGQPKHPLYVNGDTPLEPFQPFQPPGFTYEPVACRNAQSTHQ